MGKVSKAIAGVAASALVAGGAYGLEIITTNTERDAISQCAKDFEGKAREECVNDVKEAYGAIEDHF